MGSIFHSLLMILSIAIAVNGLPIPLSRRNYYYYQPYESSRLATSTTPNQFSSSSTIGKYPIYHNPLSVGNQLHSSPAGGGSYNGNLVSGQFGGAPVCPPCQCNCAGLVNGPIGAASSSGSSGTNLVHGPVGAVNSANAPADGGSLNHGPVGAASSSGSSGENLGHGPIIGL